MDYNNLYSINDNINMIDEDDWSVVSKNTDVWTGQLPYKTGCKFPTEEIKERAAISKTNKLIYNNDVNQIFDNILRVFPEIDFTTGMQIHELSTKLPSFKNAISFWESLIAGDTPAIDTDNNQDVQLSTVVDNSNFSEIIQNEVRSRFMDVISAYRVDVNMLGKPIITYINAKNIICFVNKDIPSDIEVTVIFSIYEHDGSNYVDFVEYHYDGYIKKSTYNYNDGTIGALVSTEEDRAFSGIYKASPVIVFKHNVTGNNIYGTDQFRYWSSSMLAGMRSIQNIFRLGERTREIIRKIPESAITKNVSDGSSMFFNRGTVTYNNNTEGGSPDIEYITPEIHIDDALKVYGTAIKQISMDTQLGLAFYDITSLGSNLSADSIRAAMFPARAEAKRIINEMMPSIKELVIKLGYISGLDISKSKIDIHFYDGFPKDEYKDIEAIQKRLESNIPSITLEDAIMKLDRVPLRVARQKALEIRQENLKNKQVIKDIQISNNNNTLEKNKIVDNIDNSNDDVKINSNNIKPSTYKSGDTDKKVIHGDDTVWETQVPFGVRDIPIGNYKEASKPWNYRNL